MRRCSPLRVPCFAASSGEVHPLPQCPHAPLVPVPPTLPRLSPPLLRSMYSLLSAMAILSEGAGVALRRRPRDVVLGAALVVSRLSAASLPGSFEEFSSALVELVETPSVVLGKVATGRLFAAMKATSLRSTRACCAFQCRAAFSACRRACVAFQCMQQRRVPGRGKTRVDINRTVYQVPGTCLQTIATRST